MEPTMHSLPDLPVIRTPEHWAAWLQRSALSLPHSDEEAGALMTAVEQASIPATKAEIGKYALIAIAQHFVGDQPAVVQQATAEMWVEHLSPYPAWAVRNAVFWWVGPDNKERRRRPQPGDIAERCKVETACLDNARAKAGYWDKYRGAYPDFLKRRT